MENVKWIACKDMIVCRGAKQAQKWCVRENDEKGSLVAVMLDRKTAHYLAAMPEAYQALLLGERLVKEALPKFNWGASALDANAIGLLNEFPGAIRAAMKKAAA